MNKYTYKLGATAFCALVSFPVMADDMSVESENTEVTAFTDKTPMFTEVDTNGDGIIGYDEFEKGVAIEHGEEVFNHSDKDGDEYLSKEEYAEVAKVKGNIVSESDGEHSEGRDYLMEDSAE